MVFCIPISLKQEHPLGEREKDVLRIDFDRSVKFEYHALTIVSDGGFLTDRYLYEGFVLTMIGDDLLMDLHIGTNFQHRVTALPRESIHNRLTS